MKAQIMKIVRYNSKSIETMKNLNYGERTNANIFVEDIFRSDLEFALIEDLLYKLQKSGLVQFKRKYREVDS